MRVLTAEQMREADRQAIHEIGIPSLVLMENAGRAVVAAMEEIFPRLSRSAVTVLAGCGNNGGDGFVVARWLAERGSTLLVILLGARSGVRGDALVNLGILDRLGVPVVEVTSDDDWQAQAPGALSADVVVDALFGTGLNAPLGGLHEHVITTVNESGLPVVSVDLPSGLSADQAAPIGPHVRATLTVTFGAPKLPLVVEPGASAAGTVVVADIGIPRAVVRRLGPPHLEWCDREIARALVPRRAPESHKGTFGHVLIVAGGPGKTGAAWLAATGALRSGAGLVTVATPESCVPVVAASGAEYMTLPLPEADRALAPDASRRVLDFTCDVIAAGPGLGTGPGAQALVLSLLRESSVPLVLDADAITVLAGRHGEWQGSDRRPVVLTPHPGELARLTGVTVADVQQNRIGAARDLAIRQRAFVVLKGHGTVVASPSGEVAINATGNPGMATGGAGDVLTGMVAAWIGQLQDPWPACRLAVYLHGAAGDLASASEGDAGMTAGDIAAHLGAAYLALTRQDDPSS